jgi:hypothetical protein
MQASVGLHAYIRPVVEHEVLWPRWLFARWCLINKAALMAPALTRLYQRRSDLFRIDVNSHRIRWRVVPPSTKLNHRCCALKPLGQERGSVRPA